MAILDLKCMGTLLWGWGQGVHPLETESVIGGDEDQEGSKVCLDAQDWRV